LISNLHVNCSPYIIRGLLLFEMKVNEPVGFFVESKGHIITTNFNGFLVSPENVAKSISSMRNAIKFRSFPVWVHIANVKNAKRVKTNLRSVLLKEFDWWFVNDCAAFALCVAKDDISYVESIIKTEKNKGKVRVFDNAEPDIYLSWLKSQIKQSEKAHRY
jgi:hypothetical protein